MFVNLSPWSEGPPSGGGIWLSHSGEEDDGAPETGAPAAGVFIDGDGPPESNPPPWICSVVPICGFRSEPPEVAGAPDAGAPTAGVLYVPPGPDGPPFKV